MKNKIVCLVLFGVCFLFCLPIAAQQPAKISRMGFLSTTSDPAYARPQIDAFRQSLRNLGYVEGKNIDVEYRYIEGQQDRIPSLIAEFVHLKVDVLVVPTLTSIRAAKQATA